MTYKTDKLFGKPSRLSSVVRELGYSGSPLPLEEWLKLQATIVSMQTDGGSKRVNLPAAIVSCARCGETFVKPACEVRKHFERGRKDFYCSLKCSGPAVNIQRFGERTCYRCGKPAPRRSSFGTPAMGRVFCSKACLTQEREEEFEALAVAKMRPCAHCNAMFMPRNSNSTYCGQLCASRAHANFMAGDGNPRWKDGASASRVKPHVTKRFRELRPLVLTRDGHRCVLCESADDLHVHHIDEDPLNNRVSNLVTLCRPCHHKVHFSPERATLSSQLKAHAEAPLSTTYRWRKRNASSPTAS